MKPLLSFLLLTSGLTHAADVSFTLENPGNVSAAIYDAHGRLVRELLRAQPMQSGQHTLAWDGLDRHGVAQAPGDYTWKVLGWFAAISPELLFVSFLTLAELSRGAELLRRKDARSAIALDRWIAEVRLNFAERILSVDHEVAECWARLSPQQPLPVIDGLLAATASVHDLTVVTRNAEDFERSGVRVLNPFDL